MYITEKNLFLALDKLEILSQDYDDNSYTFDLAILLALRAASSSEYTEAKTILTQLMTSTARGLIFN